MGLRKARSPIHENRDSNKLVRHKSPSSAEETAPGYLVVYFAQRILKGGGQKNYHSNGLSKTIIY